MKRLKRALPLNIVGERSHFTNSILGIDGEHNIHTHLIQWNNEGVTFQDKEIWSARFEGRYGDRCSNSKNVNWTGGIGFQIHISYVAAIVNL